MKLPKWRNGCRRRRLPFHRRRRRRRRGRRGRRLPPLFSATSAASWSPATGSWPTSAAASSTSPYGRRPASVHRGTAAINQFNQLSILDADILIKSILIDLRLGLR